MGKQTAADFIKCKQTAVIFCSLGQTPHQIHAIGYSLGGHLVGHFGRTIKEKGGKGPIKRVTCK